MLYNIFFYLCFVYLLVVRCQTQQYNLNFTDCLPYPGHSCNFKCNPGYRLVMNTTVSCGPAGQWIPSTETLCDGILSRYTTKHTFYIKTYSKIYVCQIY